MSANNNYYKNWSNNGYESYSNNRIEQPCCKLVGGDSATLERTQWFGQAGESLTYISYAPRGYLESDENNQVLSYLVYDAEIDEILIEDIPVEEKNSADIDERVNIGFSVETESFISGNEIEDIIEQSFAGTMTAPSGSTVVNPLTSLVDHISQSGELTVDQATQRVLTLFGLHQDVDLLNYDPLEIISCSRASYEQVEIAISIQAVMIKIDLIASRIGAFLSEYHVVNSLEEAISTTYSIFAEQLKVDKDHMLDLSDHQFVNDLIRRVGYATAANDEQMDDIAALIGDVAYIIAYLNNLVDTTVKKYRI